MAPAYLEALWCPLSTEKARWALRAGSLRFTAVASGFLSSLAWTEMIKVLSLCSASLGICAAAAFQFVDGQDGKQTERHKSELKQPQWKQNDWSKSRSYSSFLKPKDTFSCKCILASLQTVGGFTLPCSRDGTGSDGAHMTAVSHYYFICGQTWICSSSKILFRGWGRKSVQVAWASISTSRWGIPVDTSRASRRALRLDHCFCVQGQGLPDYSHGRNTLCSSVSTSLSHPSSLLLQKKNGTQVIWV